MICVRDFETKFEVYDDTAPEKVGELPHPLPDGNAEAWDTLKDVPFAGDAANTDANEQSVAELEADIPSEDLAITEQAAEALEALADSDAADQTNTTMDVSDLSDDYAREDAVFDVQTGEWQDETADGGSSFGEFADSDSSGDIGTADYSGMGDSSDGGDVGSDY